MSRIARVTISSIHSHTDRLTRRGLRIEGRDSTIYEGVILSGPRNVSTPSGGTHLCDATNNGANPSPGTNGISILVDSGNLCGFGIDGTFSNQFDDFFIQTIGNTGSTGNQFW